MFENRVTTKVFGRKWKEAAGGWRRLRNEEIYSLLFLIIMTCYYDDHIMKDKIGATCNVLAICIGRFGGKS